MNGTVAEWYLSLAKSFRDCVESYLPSSAPVSYLAGHDPDFVAIRQLLSEAQLQKRTSVVVHQDLDNAEIAYRAGAYKASVILCGSVMEGILVGCLERAKHIRELQKQGVYAKLTFAKFRAVLHSQDLAQLIAWTKKAGSIPGFTDDIANTVRRCRNGVHPGMVLRGEVTFGEFDVKVADLAVDFLHLLAKQVAKQ